MLALLRDWRGTKTENSLFPSHPQSEDTDEMEEEICSYCHVLVTAFKEVRNRHGKTQLRWDGMKSGSSK